MDLLREYLLKERAEILDNDIRLNAIGELEKLPPYVREPLEALRADSAKNRSMVLTLALSYGGREELVAMARRVAEKVKAGPARALGDQRGRASTALLWTPGCPGGPRHPHLGRAPAVELPVVAERLRRAPLHRDAVARLPRAPASGVPRGLPGPRAPVRVDWGPGAGGAGGPHSQSRNVTDKNRNLIVRVGSALVLLPVVLFLLYRGGYWTAALLGFAAAACTHEYVAIVLKSLSPVAWFTVAHGGGDALPAGGGARAARASWRWASPGSCSSRGGPGTSCEGRCPRRRCAPPTS